MNKIVTALIAGASVGVLAALLHFAFVQQLIATAELYESGLRVHFAGSAQPVADAAGHHDAAEGPASDHGEAGEGPDSIVTRSLMTVAFTIFTWCGFALLLYGAMQVARHYGRTVNGQTGVIWGLAGFATFTIAPTMGLAPELPGTVGADLAARQVWWVGTALATATALALLAYGRPLGAGVALALAALPHIIGAPELDSFSGVAPPELAAEFAARTIGMAFVNWALLGWLLGRASERDDA